MPHLDFDEFVAQLAEERDPLVLEEIVCLYANDNDAASLERLKENEGRLHAELVSMESECSQADRWFDVSSAIDLCTRLEQLIEKVLIEIRGRKKDPKFFDGGSSKEPVS